MILDLKVLFFCKWTKGGTSSQLNHFSTVVPSLILRLEFLDLLHGGPLVRFGDLCISLLGNHVLAYICIVGVKKLPIFLHKTIAIRPTDQMHQKLKSPSISLCLPT